MPTGETTSASGRAAPARPCCCTGIRAMWHLVAPVLAERCTVVCADLRGYGDSGKPPSDPAHATYSKRASPRGMVEVMAALGFERFMLAGHDRGGQPKGCRLPLWLLR